MSEEQNHTQQTKPETQATERSRENGERKPFERGAKRFDKRRVFKRGGRQKRDRDRKKKDNSGIDSSIESNIIQVRRVTRVAKGGKKMRFSALVVVGDRAGRVGYSIKKGVDFQSAVNKATKKAQQTMIKIDINEDGSIKFPVETKLKAARIFLKPAKQGTGLIAGGYLRPVLELAGVQNIYSKIIGGTNKISGVQAAFKALEKFKK